VGETPVLCLHAGFTVGMWTPSGNHFVKCTYQILPSIHVVVGSREGVTGLCAVNTKMMA
jgi:hypothetical protein